MFIVLNCTYPNSCLTDYLCTRVFHVIPDNISEESFLLQNHFPHQLFIFCGSGVVLTIARSFCFLDEGILFNCFITGKLFVMCLKMNIQTCSLGKLIITEITFVWFFSTMYSFMTNSNSFRCKSLSTPTTYLKTPFKNSVDR